MFKTIPALTRCTGQERALPLAHCAHTQVPALDDAACGALGASMCVCACVRAHVGVRVCVCVWVGGWVCACVCVRCEGYDQALVVRHLGCAATAPSPSTHPPPTQAHRLHLRIDNLFALLLLYRAGS